MGYPNIVVIGNGSLLTNCLKYVHEFANNSLKCIEPEKNNFSNLEGVCQLKNIEYLSLVEKKNLNDFFTSISEKTLVLSIHNSYIFGRKIFENKNLKIINFHNSLLPKHPGRNAPTWAIYEEDKEAGITWHEIIPEVDRGDIIFQKKIELNALMTGMELTKLCVNKGFETFKQIFSLLVEDRYETEKQELDPGIKMHYSYQIPNDGILNTNWSTSKISAFLRSVDYGAYSIFPKPKIFTDNWYQVESYKFIESSVQDCTKNVNEDEFYIQDENLSIKLKVKPLIN